MNSIENSLYLNYYDKLKVVKDDEKIVRNYDRNTLSLLNSNDVDVDFLVKFKKEHLLNSSVKDVENFYLERDDKQLNFINYAHNDYSLFKNVVMLIKNFRNQEKLNDLKSYMIEIILYYSLVNYSKENSYTSYLTAFFKGLKDFIDKKTIEVDDNMYSRLGVSKTAVPNDQYKVLDVANRSNNVAMYVKNINPFTKFYNKYKEEFNDDSNKNVLSVNTINCSIDYVWYDNKTMASIKSTIPGISPYETKKFKNNDDNTFKNAVDEFYKHLSRIIKLTQKNKIGKNIVILCHPQLIDIFKKGVLVGKNSSYQLSNEQLSKFNQIKNTIKNEHITLDFKSID